MAQNSVDFLWRWWNDNPFASYEQGLEAYRQAKEMHKEDCENAWMDGFDFNSNYKDFEHYYNQTFNK